ERQYKGFFKRLGLDTKHKKHRKPIKPKDAKFMITLQQLRYEQGKRTTFQFHGSTLEECQLENRRKRLGPAWDEASQYSECPSYIEYSTPDSGPSSLLESSSSPVQEEASSPSSMELQHPVSETTARAPVALESNQDEHTIRQSSSIQNLSLGGMDSLSAWPSTLTLPLPASSSLLQDPEPSLSPLPVSTLPLQLTADPGLGVQTQRSTTSSPVPSFLYDSAKGWSLLDFTVQDLKKVMSLDPSLRWTITRHDRVLLKLLLEIPSSTVKQGPPERQSSNSDSRKWKIASLLTWHGLSRQFLRRSFRTICLYQQLLPGSTSDLIFTRVYISCLFRVAAGLAWLVGRTHEETCSVLNLLRLALRESQILAFQECGLSSAKFEDFLMPLIIDDSPHSRIDARHGMVNRLFEGHSDLFQQNRFLDSEVIALHLVKNCSFRFIDCSQAFSRFGDSLMMLSEFDVAYRIYKNAFFYLRSSGEQDNWKMLILCRTLILALCIRSPDGLSTEMKLEGVDLCAPERMACVDHARWLEETHSQVHNSLENYQSLVTFHLMLYEVEGLSGSNGYELTDSVFQLIDNFSSSRSLESYSEGHIIQYLYSITQLKKYCMSRGYKDLLWVQQALKRVAAFTFTQPTIENFLFEVVSLSLSAAHTVEPHYQSLRKTDIFKRWNGAPENAFEFWEKFHEFREDHGIAIFIDGAYFGEISRRESGTYLYPAEAVLNPGM
ncbi:MAG: hypothetical protein M1814_004898, partial [Vezdaea aestivalis]